MQQREVAVVFGGAGFIGTELLQQLQAAQRYRRLVSVDLRPPRARVAGVEYIQGDVRNVDPLPGIAAPDIYNLAAIHTTPGHEDWEYFDTNIRGALEVCAFAERVRSPRLFFSSSISVYGPTDIPKDENSPCEPVSAYGRSKLLAEQIHRMWRRGGAGRQLVVVRPAVIFGKGEGGNFTRLARSLRKKHFIYPGRTDTIKACGYVGELVRSMLFVGDLDRDEVTFNFAYPQLTSIAEICAAFHRVAGFAMPKLVMPLPLMMGGGRLFELFSALGIRTGINRARMLKLVRSTNIVPRVLQDLHYSFETDLESGLSRWREKSPDFT